MFFVVVAECENVKSKEQQAFFTYFPLFSKCMSHVPDDWTHYCRVDVDWLGLDPASCYAVAVGG